MDKASKSQTRSEGSIPGRGAIYSDIYNSSFYEIKMGTHSYETHILLISNPASKRKENKKSWFIDEKWKKSDYRKRM